ncbi:hypothetical protein HanXRQr2_Chr12g0530761 [Helianthus annuus]|uniref:Uncharacterized protein n=1 Tax=Helianthus annuus TaxID=4232 RepID=A0A9K3ENV8_HELAN|nr:hypothetical protein HanXRQr2_Chr12g0530761 [Helianthus annuus]KAJ0861858.1 hypothetical protein HanPSC8_Chr12g0511401 [Helianthus annuus]
MKIVCTDQQERSARIENHHFRRRNGHRHHLLRTCDGEYIQNCETCNRDEYLRKKIELRLYSVVDCGGSDLLVLVC